MLSGVGQSPESDVTAHSDRHYLGDTDMELQALDLDGGHISPGNRAEAESRRKSPRPQHLILHRQHSSGSTSSTTSESSLVMERDRRPSGESAPGNRPGETSGSATTATGGATGGGMVSSRVQHFQNKASEDHHKAATVIPDHQRTGAEGAEIQTGSSSGTSKRKPSSLDRTGGPDSKEIVDRNTSPSRRSPKSPPRSPSWMRYKESPPRSPPIRSISPSMSPTERFPSSFVERPTQNIGREETYGEETVLQPDPSAFTFDPYDNSNQYSQGESRVYPDRPPPKPARLNDQYQFQGQGFPQEMPAHALDLATYAATVASDTAHLTSMSVSPTNLPVPTAADGNEYLEVSPETESISPPSPNYLDDSDESDVSEPTPKSIDYQGSKRQRAKPPASDWSPVTDLSPILDVSPSIEALEQEKMLVEQQQRGHLDQTSGDKMTVPPKTLTIQKGAPRKPLPQAAGTAEGKVEPSNQQTGTAEDGKTLQSPLRRYQAFDDISLLGTMAAEAGNHPTPAPDGTQEGHVGGDPHSGVATDAASASSDVIYSIRPAKEISQDAEVDKRSHGMPQRDRAAKEVSGSAAKAPPKPDYPTAASKGPAHHARGEETKVVQKRIPLKEELDFPPEIDLDMDLPPKKRDRDPNKEPKPKPKKPGPEPIYDNPRSVRQAAGNGGVSNMGREKAAHYRNKGELEKSSSTESCKSRESATSNKVNKP